MKKVILLTFALVFSICAKSQAYTMVVQKTDGTEQVWTYDINPKIVFTDDGFEVSQTDGQTSEKFVFSDIAKIYFKTLTSLSDVATKDLIFLYPNPSKTSFKIAGAENSVYQVYSMDGRLLQEGINNGNAVDISSLARGVYAVKIDGKTLKFSKQ